ncbi:MAG: queuosine precursor transporter [Nanoarchaeota archaeon]|nr:queuosine precursor transporter [Nanoarchaeota archaeon]MBU1854731.1 queuosine precursor transporter [Nanoarchaeota archaeon]
MVLSKDFKTDLLLGLFIGALILANTLGTKITTLFGVRVSVGIFFVPIMFLVTDIIAEVHGKQRAKNFVYVALIIMTFGLFMIYVSIILPANSTWGNQDAFASIFGATLRMTIASIIAFSLSQLHDVWAFDLLKRKTKGKYLWLRNNVSTMISQFIDTTVFMFLAFYHVAPKFTVQFIFSLIIPYWLFKVLFALIDTPFVYAGVWWLKKK